MARLAVAAAGLLLTAGTSAAWVPDGVPVCAADGDQSEVFVVPDGAGGSILTWRDARNGDFDVYAQRLDADGEPLWAVDGVPVCTDPNDQYVTTLALAATGSVIIVWEDLRAGASDLYAQKLDANGAAVWAADGVALCTAAGVQQGAQALPDGAGGAFVVWADQRGGNEDIYGQRLNGNGASQWTAQGVAIISYSGHQSYPQVAPDGAGGFFVVWQDGRAATTVIFGQRVASTGGRRWSPSGVQISLYSPSYNMQRPQIAHDGTTGALVAWSQSGVPLVFVGRVSDVGSLPWGGGLVVNSQALPYADSPKIAPDGQSGAYVVWRDRRSLTDDDIYGQRVNVGGVPQWAAGGSPICSQAGDQQAPQLLADGNQGAFVAWQDLRGGDSDIYLNRVDLGGAPAWGAGGLPLCAEAGDQIGPTIATLDAGNLVVAWADARSGVSDIYAEASPLLRLEPDHLDFGTVYTHRDSSFVVSNAGGGVLSGTVGSGCSYFSVLDGAGPFALGAGEQRTVEVRAQPTTGGYEACNVHIYGNHYNGSVLCEMIGVAPACQVVPDTLDFGAVPLGREAEDAFFITNDGGCRLTGTVGSLLEPFGVTQGAGPFDLGHGDTLTVRVRFRPLTNGEVTATLDLGVACGAVACLGDGNNDPLVHRLRDVPGDQGGWLDLSWDASPGDDPAQQLITRYTVWRAVTAAAAKLESGPAPDGELRVEVQGGRTFYWRLISSLDAYFLAGYAEAVPTLFDSTAVCADYTYVQILAHTANPAVFWASRPDSARSVDNLAPALLSGLAGRATFGPEQLRVTWHPNAEADLDRYEVYRGLSPDFVPEPATLVGVCRDTTWTDTDWRQDDGYCYKVGAVDVHGNRGDRALLLPAEVTGTGQGLPPVPLALSCHPNPFNPATTIRFGLPVASAVRVAVYDQRGRLVRELSSGSAPSGWRDLVWDGRDDRGRAAASGGYLVKLTSALGDRAIKITLTR